MHLLLFVSPLIIDMSLSKNGEDSKMEYITAKEAAEKWGISERRVQVLCQQGKVESARRLGWAWAIPEDTQKPKDKRFKTLINVL